MVYVAITHTIDFGSLFKSIYQIWYNVSYMKQKCLYLFHIRNVMNSNTIVLLPKLKRSLETLGENIKLARLRRKYSTEQVAERANIGRKTVWLIEKGMPTVSMGAYLQVLFVLGLDEDIIEVASKDPLGKKLQDANLSVSARAPKRK
jgi:DNA-binding XRE family transcriptional regulator